MLLKVLQEMSEKQNIQSIKQNVTESTNYKERTTCVGIDQYSHHSGWHMIAWRMVIG